MNAKEIIEAYLRREASTLLSHIKSRWPDSSEATLRASAARSNRGVLIPMTLFVEGQQSLIVSGGDDFDLLAALWRRVEESLNQLRSIEFSDKTDYEKLMRVFLTNGN